MMGRTTGQEEENFPPPTQPGVNRPPFSDDYGPFLMPFLSFLPGQNDAFDQGRIYPLLKAKVRKDVSNSPGGVFAWAGVQCEQVGILFVMSSPMSSSSHEDEDSKARQVELVKRWKNLLAVLGKTEQNLHIFMEQCKENPSHEVNSLPAHFFAHELLDLNAIPRRRLRGSRASTRTGLCRFAIIGTQTPIIVVAISIICPMYSCILPVAFSCSARESCGNVQPCTIVTAIKWPSRMTEGSLMACTDPGGAEEPAGDLQRDEEGAPGTAPAAPPAASATDDDGAGSSNKPRRDLAVSRRLPSDFRPRGRV